MWQTDLDQDIIIERPLQVVSELQKATKYIEMGTSHEDDDGDAMIQYSQITWDRYCFVDFRNQNMR